MAVTRELPGELKSEGDDGFGSRREQLESRRRRTLRRRWPARHSHQWLVDRDSEALHTEVFHHPGVSDYRITINPSFCNF